MATDEIIIKLMVDTKSNKLVFAEASNDFVDLLFFLLSLPMATVIKLLTPESMVGSIGNIYTSIANLNEKYLLQPKIPKDMHLNPMFLTSISNISLLITPSSFYPMKLSSCKNPICPNDSSITMSNTPYCNRGSRSCFDYMHEICIVNGCDVVTTVSSSNDNKGSNLKGKGYVTETTSYMICDDLSVTQMSTRLIISMMNKFNVRDINMLKKMEVKVGGKEMMEVLKASFQSTTVLSDVFLGVGTNVS